VENAHLQKQGAYILKKIKAGKENSISTK